MPPLLRTAFAAALGCTIVVLGCASPMPSTRTACLPQDLWFARMKVAGVDLALADRRYGLPQHVYRRLEDGYGVFAVRVGGYWCVLLEEQAA
jgi:hypothetical protein